MSDFKEIDITELDYNPYTMFAHDWFLLTSGNNDSYNTMTISWGLIGSLWSSKKRGSFTGNPVVTVFVRPTRYTKDFMDKNEFFTISLFDKKYKKDLGYLGPHSGRDENKVSMTSLTPLFLEDTVAFNEAKLIIRCRKIYASKILEEGFIDKDIQELSYPKKDYHYTYTGLIENVYIREEN